MKIAVKIKCFGKKEELKKLFRVLDMEFILYTYKIL